MEAKSIRTERVAVNEFTTTSHPRASEFTAGLTHDEVTDAAHATACIGRNQIKIETIFRYGLKAIFRAVTLRQSRRRYVVDTPEPVINGEVRTGVVIFVGNHIWP